MKFLMIKYVTDHQLHKYSVNSAESTRLSRNFQLLSKIFFLRYTVSRTTVTRILKGNEKQFELAGTDSSYRSKFQ